MQLEMLHVIGAAATGLLVQRSCEHHMPVSLPLCQRFAEALVTPEVINQLLILLHPSRNSGCGPVQALALKVFIKVLHVLHCFMPKEASGWGHQVRGCLYVVWPTPGAG